MALFAKGFCFVPELGVGGEIVRYGRRQDKSAMLAVVQVFDLAWLLACRSVEGSAADRIFSNDYNAISGTVAFSTSVTPCRPG
ncbi:hypothetical protein [Aurantimonas sp. C2-5-R2]|uniref:hypothetical protein n=1 Tax=Aurantimonas sp. C2-5-R2 TaxID=3113713 RepID=UPI002F91FB93